MSLRTSVIVSLALAAAACGGGESNASAPGNPNQTPQPPPPVTPQTQRDIVYAQGATTGDPVDLRLDVVQSGEPCGDLRPFAILVHGGGYTGGTKDSSTWQSAADALAARNLIAIPISYRLTGTDPVPGDKFQPLVDLLIQQADFTPPTPEQALLVNTIASAAEDTLAAVQWVQDNATELCADPGRYAVWGSSAGAYNTHAYVYSLDDINIAIPRPDVAVGYWGAEIVFDTMSPGDPPMLIVHGTTDTTVDYQGALDLEADLQANSIAYSFYTVEGAGHGWGSVNPAGTDIDGRSIYERTLDFIEDHLRGRAARYEVRSVAQTSASSRVIEAIPVHRSRPVSYPLAGQHTGIEIELPAAEIGSRQSGISTLIPIQASDALYLSYRVTFPEDFDFSTRGVLPGLGGDLSQPLHSAFDRSGWSATLSWDRGGALRPRMPRHGVRLKPAAAR